jgi:adenylate cyclase
VTAARRLAAILAADVAGYSRLIGADEGGTLQALKAIRAELIDPTIAAHHGRLLKRTEFSPSSAVSAADKVLD